LGIYHARGDAEQGVDALLEDGFRNEDISVLLPENMGTKISHTKSIPRRRKALRLALALGWW